jgi:hypothetical protein
MITGLVSGLLVPLAALVAYYFARYGDLSIGEFLTTYKNMGVLTHIISLSVLPDLLIFFLFIRQNMLKAARGVLLSTFLFTFLVLIIRFFWH